MTKQQLDHLFDNMRGRVAHEYKNVEICERWHDREIFIRDVIGKHYAIVGESVQMDKDVLCVLRRPKVYSPQTILFIP